MTKQTEFNLSEKIFKGINNKPDGALLVEDVKEFIRLLQEDDKNINQINPLTLMDKFRKESVGKDNKFFWSDFIMFIRDFYINEEHKKINKLAGENLK